MIYSPLQWMRGFPKLRNGFRQVLHKVGPHGALHDCPYVLKKNGPTKSQKTEDNRNTMINSLNNMPLRPKVSWHKGIYQKDEEAKEFEAVFLYDPETRIIVVYKDAP